MTQEPLIDNILIAHNPKYQYELIDSVTIDKTVKVGKKDVPLSDHKGFMSIVKIKPIASKN
jgi:hypothetical protein